MRKCPACRAFVRIDKENCPCCRATLPGLDGIEMPAGLAQKNGLPVRTHPFECGSCFSVIAETREEPCVACGTAVYWRERNLEEEEPKEQELK